jgi:hypothetical protein
MKLIRVLLITCFVNVLLSFATTGANAATPSELNEKLLKATDPFEGLTESAVSGDNAGIAKGIKAAKADRTATRALLTTAAAARFDTLFDELVSAQSKKDSVAVALQAAELYKLLVSSCEASALVVPMEVSLLDYAGFRTNALLKAKAPDWQALADTAREANVNWAKICDRVTDKKLKTEMEKAQSGLTSAAQMHDVSLSQSSAKRDLALVDDLEGHFAKK